jgi:phospholipase/carboxylesterase
VLEISLGEEARATLAAAGYAVEWHRYPMPHAVCAEEIAAIAAFLHRVL